MSGNTGNFFWFHRIWILKRFKIDTKIRPNTNNKQDTFLLSQPIYFVALSSFVNKPTIMKYHRLLFIIVLLIFCSCSQNAESSEMAVQLPDKAMTAPQAVENYGESPERKLIKEGRVEFETSDMAETRKTVADAVKKNKSYISSDQEYKSPGRISNTVVI